MATDPKSPAQPPATAAIQRKGVRIFTYPKIIFIMPTLVASLICGIAMVVINDQTHDPTKVTVTRVAAKDRAAAKDEAGATAKGEPAAAPAPAAPDTAAAPATTATKTRFSSPQNVIGMIFMVVFGLNLLVMAIDFPRFTIIALVLLAAAIGFFILWLNVYFNLLPPVVAFLEGIFAVANAGFYFLFATMILINFAIIWATRYLDYWEILPNEILHNHGPFSDLERYPTFNLKFDKEIPDILEYALLRSGRLVLHVANERRSIVLDNVLWIDSKEEDLKKLMRTMEVRVTTDQEMAEPI